MIDLISLLSLSISILCTLILVGDILDGRRQRMPVMNLVWPIAAFWAGIPALIAYWTFGRSIKRERPRPTWQSALLCDLHCAAGCALGGFTGEGVVRLTHVPHGWAVDFAFAFLFGVVFQYSSQSRRSLRAALKADTIALIAFEAGMLACLAALDVWPFWLKMQIALFAGFLTAYPANWWLVRRRIKSPM